MRLQWVPLCVGGLLLLGHTAWALTLTLEIPDEVAALARDAVPQEGETPPMDRLKTTLEREMLQRVKELADLTLERETQRLHRHWAEAPAAQKRQLLEALRKVP